MENNTWYNDFLHIIQQKFSKKAQLTNNLMDLLELEREAVYRRLRKEVLFTAEEIVKIATTFSISIDEIISSYEEQFTFQMPLLHYIETSKEELIIQQYIIKATNYIKKNLPIELMDVSNEIPRQLVSGYYHLNKFFLFKWLYRYGREKEVPSFSKLNISKETTKMGQDLFNAVKQIPMNNYIWDSRIFEFLIYDINYFYSIYSINDKEKELIIKDVLNLMDYMLDVSNMGCFPETRSKVNLYISQLYLDTNYTYVICPDKKFCFIHVFEKFEIYSYNSEMVNNLIDWVQLMKRASIQISEVDTKNRISFFTKQRKLIESLYKK